VHFISLGDVRAEVEACGRKYTFTSAGFIHPRVVARRVGEEHDHAILHLEPKGENGTFEFEDGRRLRMETEPRGRERRVLHEDGTEALRVTCSSGPQPRGEIFFDPAWAGDESGLMAAMIIYAIVLEQDDLAASAAPSSL
jgi:hypothetical protein